MARLLTQRDLSALGRAAHDLKGVAANLGATSLASAAERLQKGAERGDLEQATQASADINRLLPTVLAEAGRIAEG